MVIFKYKIQFKITYAKIFTELIFLIKKFHPTNQEINNTSN